MITYEEFHIPSANKVNTLYLRRWMPEGTVRATIQIAHGISEHIRRYDDFCRYLCSLGYAVYINDHLGHGKSYGEPENKGFFAEKKGWNAVIEDMHQVHQRSCMDYPELKHLLFGHSMGSFLSRCYLFTYPSDFQAVVLCGTAHMPPALPMAGKLLAGCFALFQPKGRSKLINSMAFGSYNRKIDNPQSEYDWLTREASFVQAYMEDPDCGYICTNSLYRDMMGGILSMQKESNLRKMKTDLPVLFIAGSMDPVGDYGKGPAKAAEAFRRAGLQKVTLKLYPGCRHELLNESNRTSVYKDVADWLEQCI
ncbi:MAG: lysophospholipase [Oscillospiraceae bacterium]|nr:lysophospholipase [Oscillospiraceae bacterium]